MAWEPKWTAWTWSAKRASPSNRQPHTALGRTSRWGTCGLGGGGREYLGGWARVAVGGWRVGRMAVGHVPRLGPELAKLRCEGQVHTWVHNIQCTYLHPYTYRWRSTGGSGRMADKRLRACRSDTCQHFTLPALFRTPPCPALPAPSNLPHLHRTPTRGQQAGPGTRSLMPCPGGGFQDLFAPVPHPTRIYSPGPDALPP